MESQLDQTQKYAKSPGESVQKTLKSDLRPPNEAYLHTSYGFLGDEDIPVDRYISEEWHHTEIDKIWRKTWQVACREEEIPEPGNYIVYEIADDSIIVLRTENGEIKAYVNACLHRGTQLCEGQGHKKSLRCPFHGFTWSLEGDLTWVPGKWDFPHIKEDKFTLPQVHVDIWGGFVFINLDDNPDPLGDYLEILPDHLDGEELARRYKAIHVSKIVPCNWKVAQEAFIEGFHIAETHYERDNRGHIDPHGIAAFTNDTCIQYDIWPGVRHINRLILTDGLPSQYIADKLDSEQDIIDALLRRVPEDMRPKLKPGEKARPALAAFNRAALSQVYRADLSQTSDSEMLDQVQYNLFPNFTIWPTLFAPLCYRFRPLGNDPNQSIFEVWFLHPRPEHGDKAVVAREKQLGPEQDWASAEELGVYGPIIDQDMPNMKRLQNGLKTTRKPAITLGNYQEIRIRHFHQTLDEYMEKN